jgi:hypothetical protein
LLSFTARSTKKLDGKRDGPAATPVRHTGGNQFTPQCNLPYISTEEDLENWLKALREAALAELKVGNRISL